MRYTKRQFDNEFPDDDSCLDRIFHDRYGDVTICPSCGVIDTKFYRVRGRKCYACMHCGYQLHPLAQTIFHKSSTPLKDWFYAIYLFSVGKNGVSAKEIERHLGVTYKTAHRMAKQIRSLMSEDGQIGGTGVIVEADETFVGGKPRKKSNPYRFTGYRNKQAVLGVVERGGAVRASVHRYATKKNVQGFLGEHLAEGSNLHTDESPLYKWTKEIYNHETINHALKEYSRGHVTTNTIEGFWSQVKRSISGTYHAVSPKYLQLYVDEFAFRYSYRDVAVYPVLLERVSQRA